MPKKTTAQLQRELAKLKADKRKQDAELRKNKTELAKRKKLETEIRNLKQSPILRNIKREAKRQLSKESLTKKGKGISKGAKAAWSAAGKAVNRIDRIQI